MPEQGLGWLDEQTDRLNDGPPAQTLYTALGLAPRKLGRDDLILSPQDLGQASDARSRWDPEGLSVDAAARILLLLSVPDHEFAKTFSELCRTAEVGELIALYRGLPLYPQPEQLVGQACEGLRTSMRAVFESVAHYSPFPAEHFTEAQWNQMVLKALFVESPLYPIQRLDERSNPELARIMCDYAQERRAAGRSIPVELWRCVGPHADTVMLADIKQALRSDNSTEQAAAALALASSTLAESAALLDEYPVLATRVRENGLTWEQLVSEMASQFQDPSGNSRT